MTNRNPDDLERVYRLIHDRRAGHPDPREVDFVLMATDADRLAATTGHVVSNANIPNHARAYLHVNPDGPRFCDDVDRDEARKQATRRWVDGAPTDRTPVGPGPLHDDGTPDPSLAGFDTSTFDTAD